jgi:5-methyltetrahydrofolate--homocysteine methyltransferase
MNRSYFRKRLEKNVLLVEGSLDGALNEAGFAHAACPERANIDRPDLVRDLHRRHIDAGIGVLVTNTLRAGEDHLKEHGLAGDVDRVTERGAALAVEAAQGRVLVAASLGPTRERIEPLGPLSFSRAVEVYRRQVRALLRAKVDFFLVGPLFELKEMRAAAIAIRALSELPVAALMAFGEGGLSETGTDSLTFFTVVEALDVDALGLLWCGAWEECRKSLAEIARRTALPLMLEMGDGAGSEGRAHGHRADGIVAWAAEAVAEGVCLLRCSRAWEGEQVKAVARAVEGAVSTRPEPELGTSRVASRTKTIEIGDELPVRIVGERINPTARPQLTSSIAEKETAPLVEEATKQVARGASLLDVNVGVPGIDEQEAMRWVVRTVSEAVDVPLVIDSADAEVIEAGLMEAPGKSIVNSMTGEEKSLDRILPLLRRYGAAVIGMAIDERGIPETADQRREIAERIIARSLDMGIPLRDIFIDCVTLTVGAAQDQAWETLRAIGLVKERLGARTVLGVSNISHGMPQRGLLNRSFLAMALGYGLDLPILNPYAKGIDEVIAAADALLGRDRMGLSYIERYGGRGS